MNQHRVRVAEPPPADAAAGLRWSGVDGRPALPVVAGMDFSRVPRSQWQESVRRLRDAGVTAVATTVFWNHHCPGPDTTDFTGRLELGAFVSLVRAAGLDVVLRLGPDLKSGARWGGLPDWVVGLPALARTDDPGYLEAVAGWLRAVADQVGQVRLLAIQLDGAAGSPAHLTTLRRLATDAGLHPRMWLTTGETADGFVGLQHAPAEAYWTGAGTGRFLADGYRLDVGSPGVEVGVAMAPAAHRRPVVAAADAAALVLARIAAGSSWLAYRTFHDGRDQRPGLHESQAAGSPNDLSGLDVDAGAPLAVDGHRRPSWYRLRLHNLLLATWGDRLATMPATLPPREPWWTVRSDGASGFLFVSNRGPGRLCGPLPGVRFVVETAAGEVAFPPRDLPAGASLAWPFRLPVGEAELAWATAQPVTVVDWRGRPLLVLAEAEGVAAELAWREDTRPLQAAGPGSFGEVVTPAGVLARWVVLGERDASRVGLADGLELTADGLAERRGGPAALPPVAVSTLRHASPPPLPGAGRLGRRSAPSDWETAARVRLRLTPTPGASLVIDWVGDAARLWDGDRLVADSLYCGREWRIGAPDLAGATELVAEFVRLHPDAVVHLPSGRPRGARLNRARLELP